MTEQQPDARLTRRVPVEGCVICDGEPAVVVRAVLPVPDASGRVDRPRHALNVLEPGRLGGRQVGGHRLSSSIHDR